MDHPDGDGRNIEDYFKDPNSEAIARAKVRLDELLDSSVVGKGDLSAPEFDYIIDPSKQIDLSKLNFAKLSS